MFKNATFLPFYFADNQLFSNSETLVKFIDYLILTFFFTLLIDEINQ